MTWKCVPSTDVAGRPVYTIRNGTHSLVIHHWIGNCCGANSVSRLYYLPKTLEGVADLIAYMKTQPWQAGERGPTWPMIHFFGWAKKTQVEAFPAFFNYPNVTILHEFPNGAHGPETLVNFMLDLTK